MMAPPRAPSALSEGFRSLRSRNYRLFWLGQLVSLAGTWMQDVALSWLVLHVTHSPEALGLTMAIRFLPALLFSTYAGVLVDRLPKRLTLVGTQSVHALVALTLAILYSGNLITVATIWLIYILAGLRGLVDALDGPTRQSFVVEMVGPKDLPNAVALNSTLFNAARVIGPALGAAVIASPLGLTGCFYFNAVSFLAVIGGLLAMRTSELHLSRRITRDGSLTQLREGFRYVRSTPEVMVIFIVMAMVGAFGYNFQTLLPLVSTYILKGDASNLALLMTVMGIGAVLAGLFVAFWGKPNLKLLLVSAAIFTVLLAATAFSRSTLLTCALLFLNGVVGILFLTSANTRLQLGVPGDLRGRVMGMYVVLFIGTTPIGSYLIGYLAEHISSDQVLAVQLTIVIMAGLCAAGVIIGWLYAVRHRGGPVSAQEMVEKSSGAA